ncbi:hypothetical protein B566_EDAN003131 [Ephemera danica]|nr:hypothetical protein B566_EDAN003131 [Ephemera danica]
MDYSYLNQGFEAAGSAAAAASCSLAGMEAAGMPCSYGDLTSCSQMGQAYRYTAAMRYNPGGVPSPSQCAVMARGPQEHHHRAAAAAAAMFPASMNLQMQYGQAGGTASFLASFSHSQHYKTITQLCPTLTRLCLDLIHYT